MADPAAAVHDWINRRLFAEYERLERDCSEAIWLTPDRLASLRIVKDDRLGAPLCDAVGWVACQVDR